MTDFRQISSKHAKRRTKVCREILIFEIFVWWCPFTQYTSHVSATPTSDVDFRIQKKPDVLWLIDALKIKLYSHFTRAAASDTR